MAEITRKQSPSEQAKRGRCGTINQDGEPVICSRWAEHAGRHRGYSKGGFYNGPRFEWENERREAAGAEAKAVI